MNSVVRLREYETSDDPAALALERRCPQGETFRIVFKRDSFHRRTDGFAAAQLLCAWSGDTMVGIGGGAINDVVWRGARTKALLLYDFRVDPLHRRSGVARMMAEALIDWARTRAELGYAYALGDNRAIQGVARQWIGADTAPAFVLLAHPTHRKAGDATLANVAPGETLAIHRQARGDVILDCANDQSLKGPEVVGSWSLERDGAAGCSAWSSRGVLEEVVTGLPATLRAAGWLLGGEWGRRLGLPHAPMIGETLRSWILFHTYASDGAAAAKLFTAVAAQARKDGIDYCHVVAPPDAPWLETVRKGLPRAFAPQLPFTIMARTIAGEPLKLDAPLVDPRDI